MGNANPQTRREFTRRGDRIEELVSRIETSGDLAKRAVAQELLQAVIELHGVALERILDAVAALPQADTVLDSIAADEIVSGVLALHNIHPVALETRVRSALESARPYLNSHGGDVELASIEDGTVHVRLRGTCGSCSSSTRHSSRQSNPQSTAPLLKDRPLSRNHFRSSHNRY